MKKYLPWVFSLLNLIFAIVFVAIFFYLMSTLPNIVPTHWTPGIGFDKWGSKTELYPLAIIPSVVALIVFPLSILAIKKNIKTVTYFINSISLFLTVVMMLASLLMISNAKI